MLAYDYDAYVRLIRQVDELVAGFERHRDPATAERAAALLSGVDALHREGLSRFVEALREAGAGELVEAAADDPVIRIFLGLYDLAELDLPEPREAGPLQGFVPLEELAVGRDPNAAPHGPPPPGAGAEPGPSAAMGTAAGSGVRAVAGAPTTPEPPEDAAWRQVARAHEIPAGSMRTVIARDRRVLILNVRGDFRAYHDACPGTELPLEFGGLEGTELRCPWHDCRFDARTGRRTDGRAGPLTGVPIRVHEGAVRVSPPGDGPADGAAPADDVRLVDLARDGDEPAWAT